MQKYVCSICNFIYDEKVCHPEGGIAPGTLWSAIPDDWVCPICGATKSEFRIVENLTKKPVTLSVETDETEVLRELSSSELYALFSNLAKGCEKQYRPDEAAIFMELAEYYKKRRPLEVVSHLQELKPFLEKELENVYPAAFQIATANADRGARRALTWSEKCSRILSSLIGRFEKQGTGLLDNTNIYVCEICGFVYIGDLPPDICPVCKVPSFKITPVQKEVV